MKALPKAPMTIDVNAGVPTRSFTVTVAPGVELPNLDPRTWAEGQHHPLRISRRHSRPLRHLPQQSTMHRFHLRWLQLVPQLRSSKVSECNGPSLKWSTKAGRHSMIFEPIRRHPKCLSSASTPISTSTSSRFLNGTLSTLLPVGGHGAARESSLRSFLLGLLVADHI